MLIHECEDCRTLSINRIATDDDPETILSVFEDSLLRESNLQARTPSNSILLLTAEHIPIVRARLYGQDMEMPVTG